MFYLSFFTRTLNEILERYSSDTFEARFPLEPDVESKIIPPLLRALRLSGREGIEAPADVVLRQMFFISKEHIGSELFDRILKVFPVGCLYGWIRSSFS